MPGHAVYRLIVLQYGGSEELEHVRFKYVYEDFCAVTMKSYKDASGSLAGSLHVTVLKPVKEFL